MSLKLSKKEDSLLTLGRVKLHMVRKQFEQEKIDEFVQIALRQKTPDIIETARNYLDDIVSD
jgi:hypothetical protein